MSTGSTCRRCCLPVIARVPAEDPQQRYPHCQALAEPIRAAAGGHGALREDSFFASASIGGPGRDTDELPAEARRPAARRRWTVLTTVAIVVRRAPPVRPVHPHGNVTVTTEDTPEGQPDRLRFVHTGVTRAGQQETVTAGLDRVG